MVFQNDRFYSKKSPEEVVASIIDFIENMNDFEDEFHQK